MFLSKLTGSSVLLRPSMLISIKSQSKESPFHLCSATAVVMCVVLRHLVTFLPGKCPICFSINILNIIEVQGFLPLNF